MSDLEKGKKLPGVGPNPETTTGEKEVFSDFTLESFQNRLNELTAMLNKALNDISLVVSDIREHKQTEPNNEEKMNMLLDKYAEAVEEANKIDAKINNHLTILNNVMEDHPNEDDKPKKFQEPSEN